MARRSTIAALTQCFSAKDGSLQGVTLNPTWFGRDEKSSGKIYIREHSACSIENPINTDAPDWNCAPEIAKMVIVPQQSPVITSSRIVFPALEEVVALFLVHDANTSTIKLNFKGRRLSGDFAPAPGGTIATWTDNSFQSDKAWMKHITSVKLTYEANNQCRRCLGFVTKVVNNNVKLIALTFNFFKGTPMAEAECAFEEMSPGDLANLNKYIALNCPVLEYINDQPVGGLESVYNELDTMKTVDSELVKTVNSLATSAQSRFVAR